MITGISVRRAAVGQLPGLTLPAGPVGATGPGLYEAAVAAGLFAGTLAEFLETFVGREGPSGASSIAAIEDAGEAGRRLLGAATPGAAKVVLGLSRVEDTADAEKPVSQAVALALAERQPVDPTLTALAALVTAADRLIYATGSDAFATAALTAFARTILSKSDAAGVLSALGGNVAGGPAVLDGAGKVPTSILPPSVLGDLQYQGAWNAATNSPAIPAASAANKGWYYVVRVAGATVVAGLADNDWQAGDWIVSNGEGWDKIDNTDLVKSVAGLTGVIAPAALKAALALAAADVGLGTGASPAFAGLSVGPARRGLRVSTAGQVTATFGDNGLSVPFIVSNIGITGSNQGVGVQYRLANAATGSTEYTAAQDFLIAEDDASSPANASARRVLSVLRAGVMRTMLELSDAVTAYANVLPTTDNAFVLGSSGARWANGFFVNLSLSNALTVANGGTGATSAPTARANLGLGSGDAPTFAGLTLTGAATLSSATLTTPLAVSSGGTGATTAAAAATNLGLGASAAVSFGGVTVSGQFVSGQANAGAKVFGLGLRNGATGAGTEVAISLSAVSAGVGVRDVQLAAIQTDASTTSADFVIRTPNSDVPVESLRILAGGAAWLPGRDNVTGLGSASKRFGTVYAGTSAISTSDAQAKVIRGELTEAELDAWGEIRWCVFRMAEAFEVKGEAARLHAGLIAQEVEAAFARRGLDAAAFALWCSDPVMVGGKKTRTVERPRMEVVKEPCVEIRVEAGKAVRRTITVERERQAMQVLDLIEDGAPVLDEAGDPVRIEVPIIDRVDESVLVEVPLLDEKGAPVVRLGLRYDHCNAFEAAWTRRELARVSARLAAVESRPAAPKRSRKKPSTSPAAS